MSKLHGVLFAAALVPEKHVGSTMQAPDDRVVKAELANAEVLLQQSHGYFDPAKLLFDSQTGSHTAIANYVGPLKAIGIPGTVNSFHKTPVPVAITGIHKCVARLSCMRLNGQS